jgi:HlyD family secretion protein
MNMTPKNKHRRRNLWIALGAVALAATAWALRAPPVAVSTAVVKRGTLVATASAEGRTRVKELYVVAAPVDGQLQRVVVHPGDLIRADATVAEILPGASRPLDPRTRAEASAAVSAAEAAVARAGAAELEAKAALEHAESQLDTTRQLAAKQAAPRMDLEHRGHEAEIRRRAAEGAAAAARTSRAELARARAVLAPASVKPGQITPVQSPVAGRILRVLRESAGPVAAGTPLLEVGDVGSLEVHADLLSSDAAKVHPGAAATITGWGGPQPIRAQVRRVDPAAFTKVSALGLEEQRVHVVLDLVEPPPAGLGHDYRVDAAVVVWEGKDVLRVPSTALFRSGDRWTVFVVRDGRARKTFVDAGASDGTWTAVTGDLKEGEAVVVQPSDAIEDGTRVRGTASG